MPTSKSKRIFQILLLSGTAISLFFVPWILIKAWIMPLPDTIQEQLDATTAYGFDGIITYVDRAGAPPEYYAAGWHNRAEKIPAKPEALFKIASIGKLYVAVSISKLAGQGLLDLNKPLTDYFPALKGRIEYADQINIRMLVQHRSGIPNFTAMSDFWTNPPRNREETLERVLDTPADFKPGEDYAYCNTNYLLLTMLIERISGKSKFEFIQQHILQPLKLENTYGSVKDVDPDRVMSGYYAGVEEDLKNSDYGSMVASAEDVGTFLRALNDGSVFEEGEQEIYASIYVYNHTGLIPGYQSIAEYHKDIDAVIVQFVNSSNFDGYTWNLSEIFYNRVVKIVKRRAEK